MLNIRNRYRMTNRIKLGGLVVYPAKPVAELSNHSSRHRRRR